MPTYDYVCDACGHAFELFHSMKDDPIKKCPQCKKLKLRRLMGTGGGIIFKGTGFYQTDYKSTGPKETKPSGDSSAAKPAAAPSTETPSKKKK